MFSGMLAGFLKVAAVAVVTGGVAVAFLAAACGGGDGSNASGRGEPSVTVTITPESTAAPTATQEPVPTDPPAPTATPQPPAPTATYTPRPTCLPKTHDHLDIGLLGLQPGMEDAIITEIDENSIRVEIQSAEFIITGVGKLVGLGGYGEASDELLTQMNRAIDAVAYAC